MATRTDYESESYNDLLIRLPDVTPAHETHAGNAPGQQSQFWRKRNSSQTL